MQHQPVWRPAWRLDDWRPPSRALSRYLAGIVFGATRASGLCRVHPHRNPGCLGASETKKFPSGRPAVCLTFRETGDRSCSLDLAPNHPQRGPERGTQRALASSCVVSISPPTASLDLIRRRPLATSLDLSRWRDVLPLGEVIRRRESPCLRTPLRLSQVSCERRQGGRHDRFPGIRARLGHLGQLVPGYETAVAIEG